MISDKDRGIRLDVGCGPSKQPGFVGLDRENIPGVVDIVHDLEAFPYPIPDEECHIIVASHILEHIKPWLTLDVFNEFWRIMKPGGQLMIATPYAGSPLYWQDPTHCNGFTEGTFYYFDPRNPVAYNNYRPRPWHIERGFPMWQATGVLEVVMTKVVA